MLEIPLGEMTPEQLAEHNKKVEADLKTGLVRMQEERQKSTAAALDILTGAIEAESFLIPFGDGKGIIRVLANPSRSIRKSLARIAELAIKAEKGAEISEEVQKEADNLLASILESIVLEPKCTKQEWLEYPYLEEVSARVIYNLVIDTQKRQEEMKTQVESFRANKRGVKSA